MSVTVTIATHNGSKVRREHNIRNRRVTDKESHIDPNGTYEIWHDENPRDAYARIFGEAVEEYNQKQTRDDRKITDYYNHISKDAKKHPVYEMIVGVYPTLSQTVDSEKEILEEFVMNWKERNPNLEMIGAYYHADEKGHPHCHIDYIPVAHGYEKGMHTQNGLVKALGEMGFEKEGRRTAQIQWEARENAYLESLCKEYGLNVIHPRIEGREHLEKQQYILEQTVSALKGEHMTQEEIQKNLAGTNLWGKAKGYVKVDYDEYRAIQNTINRVENVEQREKELAEREYGISLEESRLRKLINENKNKSNQIQETIRKNIEEKVSQIMDEMKREAMVDPYQKRMINWMKSTYDRNGVLVWDSFMDREEKRAIQKAYEREKPEWER